MLHIEDRHKKIVLEILSKYPLYTFYAYGSRTKGTQHKLSDLDLVFMEPMPFALLFNLKQDFEDSDLPFTVDCTYFDSMSPEFKRLIEKNLVLMSSSTI